MNDSESKNKKEIKGRPYDGTGRFDVRNEKGRFLFRGDFSSAKIHASACGLTEANIKKSFPW